MNSSVNLKRVLREGKAKKKIPAYKEWGLFFRDFLVFENSEVLDSSGF